MGRAPSPRARGEGRGEGLGAVITNVNRANESVGLISIRGKSPKPLTLTLSPLKRGEGTRPANLIEDFFKKDTMRGLRLFERNRSRDLRRAQTPAEQKLWRKLRGRQLGEYKFVRQEPIGPFFADFVCREKKLIVEVDGATHSTEDELAYDARREKFLAGEGYRVLRVSNDEVFNNLDDLCETIFLALQTQKP